MKVCLISTYELGHQPFGVASPARWLADAGADVRCIDLSVDCLDEQAVREAGLIAIYLPMHTATRLAAAALPKVRALNPDAHLAFYGLYASVNADYLRGLGAGTILAGEVETALVRLYDRLTGEGDYSDETAVRLDKQRFRVPQRQGLPDLSRYAVLHVGDGTTRTVGYTEATRGCKHLCRHCPVVPVYQGRFFAVGRDVVMEDVRRQVAAGAQHITFGDPDFLNGPGHAMRVVEDFHTEFPEITYDATIKVEHLLNHRDKLRRLGETGCLFVTTAVESVDDDVLAKLDKGHTRADFVEVVAAARDAGLNLSPTFIPFHPWTTPEGFRDLLALLAELDLIENVAPVQLSIRLLIPQGSRILELDEMADYLGDFDSEKLSYAWAPGDPSADALQVRVRDAVQAGERENAGRRAIFQQVWEIAHEACGRIAPPLPPARADSRPVPAMSEPWYCCAEPTEEQLARL
ncbi:CUAEP/CCAEP-tail radical SAM (seleno)protein [Ferruginivarius sediminum]|uniref:Radical SAM protein n=1 Tax=Ferruginivarius sediminum TaxID=2661937 RepID=A0A369TC62_9PROT|nr:CUAEP/CCAEP-tail radical SAM protein [Ferruginivarius sediminum]RDD62931.1 radical SAM protein [Ferruginivarius sediminum]